MNTKIKTLFTVGILLILLPATGFPVDWMRFFIILFGLTVCYVAYLYYQDARKAAQALEAQKPKTAGTEMFVENSVK